MLHRFLLGASITLVTGILFPVLSLISGADRALLEDAAIVTWDTHLVQPRINKLLAKAYIGDDNDPKIPTLIPDIYTLHYLTFCSSEFIPGTGTKNASSTYCNSRWLDQPTNMTQILLYAVSTGLHDLRKFPPGIWNETTMETIIAQLPSILVSKHGYNTASIWSAIVCLFMGFAFAVFSVPLVFFATFVAITGRSMFRILPHVAVGFAAVSATFLTFSARIEYTMANSLAKIPSELLEIDVSTSATFQFFQWSGAWGMWSVVLLLWLGGVWRQKIVVVNSRYKVKLLGKE